MWDSKCVCERERERECLTYYLRSVSKVYELSWDYF